jgi:uncharacterized protein YifN (PemK superfamily)
MSEITIHTGFMGDQNRINIVWYDHNNVQHTTHIQADIQPEDKPRTLVISIDGKVVYQQNNRGTVYA